VRRSPAFVTSRPWALWLRKIGFAAPLGGCFFSVALAAAFAGFQPGFNTISFADGVLLAYLLLVPRRRWAPYLMVGFSAQWAAGLLVNTPWQTDLLLAALHLTAVLFAALLLRGRFTALPRFTDHAYLLRFAAYAVLAGPLAGGAIFALIAALQAHSRPVASLSQFAVVNGLGAAVAAPACVALLRSRLKTMPRPSADWVYLALLVALTAAAFSQTRAPAVLFVYPLLLLLLIRLGFGWAALGNLLVAVVGSWCTARGLGPFARSNPFSSLEPSILLQAFMASGMSVLFSVAVVLQTAHSTERRLQGIAALHAMVTEHSRDAIIFAGFDGQRTYVSAAAARIFGWTAEELANHKSLEFVHCEDRLKVEAALAQLRAGAESALIECRARKSSGEYIWVEASLSVVRNPETGIPSGVLNLVRDISAHKLAEQQLQDAYHAVEALAITDALTGLANRRRFDQCLSAEWRRALREREPLSLLMIDVDLFKSYNDMYGHLRGDSCLRQVAEAAMDVVARPGDLVARFGGEEFAIVLPHTGNEGAMHVANDICEALRARCLPHRGNPFGIMTISVGCATSVPRMGQHGQELIEMADHALYASKRNGRNQVCGFDLAGEAMNKLPPHEPLQDNVGQSA